MATVVTILIVAGLIGLFVSYQLVYNPLNTAQLSMNIFHGKDTKEHLQGLSWKWLWYKLQKPQINMQASIIITSGGILVMEWDKFISEKVYEKISPRIYETKDSVLYGSWAAAIRPLKGELSNFILKTPQVGALVSMSEVDLTISDYLAKEETEKALGEKRAISEMVAKIFGGEQNISDLENSYGITISDPKLFDLNLGKKSQDAAEKLFEAKKFREAMEELKDEISDPDKRSNAIFIANGMVKKNIVNIEGLEGATKNIADAFIALITKQS